MSDAEKEALLKYYKGCINEEHPFCSGLLYGSSEYDPLSGISDGHVNAVLTAMEHLGLMEIISLQPCPERDVIAALVVLRIIDPMSKYSTRVLFKTTSVGLRLHLLDCSLDRIYRAMDWVLTRKTDIESQLVRRHISDGSIVFVDVSSSYYEGERSLKFDRHGQERETGCELPRMDYSRDKKKGKTQINYAQTTDMYGRPLRIDIYPGNISDYSTFMPSVDVLLECGIKNFTIVGDRGEISGKDIILIQSQYEGIHYISALRAASLHKIIKDSPKPLNEFVERDLFEFVSVEFPNDRLIACRNPDERQEREKTRDSLIKDTTKFFDEIKSRVISGSLRDIKTIGEAVGEAKNKRNVAKYFQTEWGEGHFDYSLKQDIIDKEKLLDGVFVVRTSLPFELMDPEECVRRYKDLALVDRGFRSKKSIDLRVRPIFHFADDRIRSHIFIVMLAEYVLWHMKTAWRPLTFADPEQELKANRNPALKPPKSDTAKNKESTGMVDATAEAMSFQNVLNTLACSNYHFVVSGTGGSKTKTLVRTPVTPYELRALALLEGIRKTGK
jgi:transposase